MFQNLCALTDLGHEVHLAVIGSRTPVDREVAARVASVHLIDRVATPLWLRPLERFLNPETFALRFPQAAAFDRSVASLARRLAPELIWADSTFALALAPRADYPVVFGNYDFLFKLKAVRDKTSRASLAELLTLRRRLKRPDALTRAALEAFEMKIAGEAAHVMCVSASEDSFLREHKIASSYIPIVGPTIARPSVSHLERPLRLFLFGNHNTAHGAALSEIRHRVWPILAKRHVPAEWHQIGRAPSNPDDDWQWMERTFDQVHGFVDDLATVFGMGDLSIVPYRHDTGFRTKFTVAAAYGVVSAGYDETFLCAPEFTRGVNAIVAKDPEQLAAAIASAASDPSTRRELGLAARELYEKTYTFEAQLPRYARILEQSTRRASL
jgi:hypothetical protein